MKFLYSDLELKTAPAPVEVLEIARYGGTVKYLANKADIRQLVRVVTYWQGVNREFENVAIRPYKGRKYDRAAVEWVVVGWKGVDVMSKYQKAKAAARDRAIEWQQRYFSGDNPPPVV